MTFENAISVYACRPKVCVWRRAAFAAALVISSTLFAAEVSSADAARAAKAWVERGYAMGALATARTVSGVDEIEDTASGARLHVVKFEGGGFVVLSADDLVDPVISFSATGNGISTDDDNPFWTLLRGDIAAREATAGVVRGAGSASGRRSAVSRARPASATSTTAQRKWSALLGGGTRLQSAGDGVPSLSDMRVPPLVQSQWGQDEIGVEPCFNLYTPNNDPCGCVATAGAQIMRYFQWPAVSMEMPRFTNPHCRVDGVATRLTTQGGSYDWANMPLNPTPATISPIERQALGKLTSDIGICCGMAYDDNSASIGSYMLAETFTNHFGYGSALAAQWNMTVDQSGTETFRRALLSNFDAGLPVVLSLKGVRYDHAVVSDGYGYSDGSLFVHLNFGWTGISDAWYSPPHLSTGDDDDYNYNRINGLVFNIFPDLPSSTVICSGRVLDADGNPVDGAVVSYYKPNATSVGGIQSGNDTGYVMTGSTGIYALRLQPGQYVVRASLGSMSATTSVTLSPNVATKTAHPNQYWPDPPAVINNLIDQDLVLSNLAGVAVPVFDPPPCLFYPSTNVSITCATPDATIRYTLDGTEPTATSKVYMGPIAISDDVVITVKAWADGMNPSAAISAAYTFDVSQGAPPGDYFINPIIISGASGTRVVEDNSFYTEESGEPLHTKWLDEAENLYHYYYQYNTIWYEWTAPGSGLMTFTARLVGTHILPPMLAVYTGESLSSIERIVFDADEDEDRFAKASFNARQGVTYRIVGMSGYEGLYGTFTLTWSGDLVAEPTVTPLEVTTSVLPPATSGVPYAVTLEASGGVAPYVWSSAATALPAGLSLSPGGVLSGTPTTPGVESVTIFVTDDVGTRTGRTFNLTVESEVEPGPDARYSIRFNANGGMGDMDDQVIAVGETQNLNPCLFARVGYVFTGWATSPTGPALYGDGTGVKDLATSEGVVDLYACWVANRYAIMFEANGGEGVGTAQRGVYGTAFALSVNLFTWTGHTFKGWATNAGGDVAFADGATVSNLTAEVNGRVTLYAVWAVNRYTLSFDANGGSEVAPITQDYGTAVTAPAAPARTGYTFAGWNPPIPGTMPANDMRMVAQWMVDQEHIFIHVKDSYPTKDNGEFLLELSDLVASYTAPKVAVKGLPTGLKFDAKTLAISGKATKPGIYTVKISVANATVKKAVEKEFLLTVPNLVWDSIRSASGWRTSTRFRRALCRTWRTAWLP